MASSRWSRSVATAAGLGDLVPAPGTLAGSLPTAVCWWAVITLLPWPQARFSVTAVLVVTATVAGIWASGLEAARRGVGDPGPVVIDEVAGQLVTYLVALPYLDLSGWRSAAVATAAGFFLFRGFDIVKPWPARRLERLPGGLGIMADDLAAGVEAGIVLAFLAKPLLWLSQL